MTAAYVNGVLLTGSHLYMVQQALDALARERRRNGLPASRDAAELRRVITTQLDRREPNVAPEGQQDSSRVVAPEHGSMSTKEAAELLGVSTRTARRMASRLGGRLVGGVLMLDRIAINEHIEGCTQTKGEE